jgi:serine-type D-Ala-D-Ala carboxypeptidase (penicillin-binding protein 5/6)
MSQTLQAAPTRHVVATPLTPRSVRILPKMNAPRYAARALAMSLSVTAAGALCVAVPASAATGERVSSSVNGISTVSTSPGNPVGGRQLARRGVIVNLPPGVPAPPAMSSPSFVLADMDTGEILVARAPHVRRAPASTMKALTALTLIPILDPDATILVKPQDVNVVGTRLGILPDTRYSVRTLLQGMLVTSGNDAAFALARGNRSVAVTLKAMNAKAAALNALDTVAKDPSGLDKVGQSSSAYDLALIGRAGMKLPDFRRYVGSKQLSLPGGRSVDGSRTPGFKLINHNKLIHNYRGAIGIKNGYTNSARFSYIEAATRGGKTYLLTEMSSPRSSWRPTAALLDWAFAHGSSVTPVGTLVDPVQPAIMMPLASKPTATPSVTATASAAPPAVAARPQTPPATPAGASTRMAAVEPWVAVAGALGALAVVGAWTRRKISRKQG